MIVNSNSEFTDPEEGKTQSIHGSGWFEPVHLKRCTMTAHSPHLRKADNINCHSNHLSASAGWNRHFYRTIWWNLTYSSLGGGRDRCSNKREKCHVGKLQTGKCSTLNNIQGNMHIMYWKPISLFIFATFPTNLRDTMKTKSKFVIWFMQKN